VFLGGDGYRLSWRVRGKTMANKGCLRQIKFHRRIGDRLGQSLSGQRGDLLISFLTM
jgi:hypothetical protein